MSKKDLPPWVRLAAGFHQNPKVMELAHRRRHRAIAVYCCALGWSCEQRTDGWIPVYALPAIHGTLADAGHLVDVGLWLANAGGWAVHDWDVWQETDADKRARSEAMRARANIRHHGHPDGAANVTGLRARRDAQRNA